MLLIFQIQLYTCCLNVIPLFLTTEKFSFIHFLSTLENIYIVQRAILFMFLYYFVTSKKNEQNHMFLNNFFDNFSYKNFALFSCIIQNSK